MCAGWVAGRRRRRRPVRRWRRRRRLRAAGRGRLRFLGRRDGGGDNGSVRAFGRRGLRFPRRRPRLPGGLRDSGCVHRRTRRDEERTGSGGCVAGIGATARVWRMGRLCDGGGGGWDGVGRGWWGAGGRVHRRNCAGGRTEARDWAVARGKFQCGVSSRVRRDAARCSRRPKYSAWDSANRPASKFFYSAAQFAAPEGSDFDSTRCKPTVNIARPI
jgi:hypothetical protein